MIPLIADYHFDPQVLNENLDGRQLTLIVNCVFL